MEKCKRCRFKSDITNTCITNCSEYVDHDIDTIPEDYECDNFYSEDDSENYSYDDQDTEPLL